MKEKRKYLLAIAVGVLCLVAGFLLGLAVGGGGRPDHIAVDERGYLYVEDNIWSDEIAISQSPQGWLLNESLTVSAADFPAVIEAFFAAPATFYCSTSAEADDETSLLAKGSPAGSKIPGMYRVRSAKVMSSLGALLKDLPVTAASETATAPKGSSEFQFRNAFGVVTLETTAGQTTVGLSLQRTSSDPESPEKWEDYTFLIDEDLTAPLKKTFQKIEKVGKPVTNDEFMGNFE